MKENSNNLVIEKDKIMDKYYAGIGSRKTPPEILSLMSKIAIFLSENNYILRSGGASGSDLAFSKNIDDDKKQIFLPWKGFNNNWDYKYPVSTDALKLAEEFHPAWERCSNGARKLHARNVFQVLGYDLNSPSEFIICWTKGGKLVGGTAQALRIAIKHSIKIYNLAINEDKKYWEEKINEIKR